MRCAINGTVTDFMLDSGASFVCVPQELVLDDQLLPKTTTIRLANNDRVLLGRASVRVQLGNRDEWTKAVVIEAGATVLYPINFTNKDDVDLATQLTNREPTLCATTRLQRGAIQDKSYRDEDLTEYGLPELFELDDERDMTYMPQEVVDKGTNFDKEMGEREGFKEKDASGAGAGYSAEQGRGRGLQT